MKRLMLIIAGLLMTTFSYAEITDNPDRVPSIGIEFMNGGEDGSSTVIVSPNSASQMVDIDVRGFLIDARVPVSRNLTLTAGFATSETKVKAQETFSLAGQDSKTDGNSFRVGLRFYIQ